MSILEQIRKEIEVVGKLNVDYRGGFKVSLILRDENRYLNIPCKLRRIKSRDMVKVERRGPNGGKVVGHYDGGKRYYEVIGDIKTEITEDQIRYVQILQDGAEMEVNPLPRFDKLEVVKRIPRSMIEEFVIEGFYELWSETDNTVLWKVAEELSLRDECLVALYSFGGFKAYTCLIYPVVKSLDGEKYFVMEVLMCTQKKEFGAWMPIDKPIKTKKKPAGKKMKEGIPTVQARLLA